MFIVNNVAMDNHTEDSQHNMTNMLSYQPDTLKHKKTKHVQFSFNYNELLYQYFELLHEMQVYL